MAELKEQIEQIGVQIEEVSELFYQQKNQEGYTKLEKVIVGVAQVIETAYAAYQGDEAVIAKIQKLTATLQETMEAMEEKDTVLLADMLKYEVLEQLETLK